MKSYFLLLGIMVLVLTLVGWAIAVEQSTSATVTVNEFISVSLTSGYPVTFGSVDPSVTTDATNDPLVVTVGSETNVNYNITTKTNQTNFVSGGNTFAVGAMTQSTTDEGGETAYTTTAATVYGNQAVPAAKSIYHEITVPAATPAGNYNTGIVIAAIKA